MSDNLAALIDPGAFIIVMAGTVLACVARCGWRDVGAALREASGLMRPGFDVQGNRRALARAVIPFVFVEILVLGVLIFVPEITLFLPRAMGLWN